MDDIGLVVGIVFGAVLGWLATGLAGPDIQSEAISRGYALYCPDDGRFAWKGECDQ